MEDMSREVRELKLLQEEYEADRDFYEMERTAYIETLKELQEQINEKVTFYSNSLKMSSPSSDRIRSELEAKLANSLSKRFETENELAESKNQLLDANSIIETLNKKLSDKDKIVENLETMLSLERANVSRLEIEKNVDSERVKNTELEFKNRILILEENLNSAEQRESELLNEQENLSSKFLNLENAIEQERQLVAKLQGKLVQQAENIQDLQKKIGSSDEKIERLKNELSASKRDLEAEREIFTTRISAASKEIEDLRSACIQKPMKEDNRKETEEIENEKVIQLQSKICELEQKINLQRQYMISRYGNAIPEVSTQNGIIITHNSNSNVVLGKTFSNAPRTTLMNLTNRLPAK